MVDMRNGSDHCVELGNEGVIWSVQIVGFWRGPPKELSTADFGRSAPAALAARPRPDDDLN